MMNRRSFIGGLAGALVLSGQGSDKNIKDALHELLGGPQLGTALPAYPLTTFNKKELGVLTGHFNSITPENCMKWGNINPSEDKYNFKPTDSLITFAKANNFKVVGHCLVFNRANCFPNWLVKDGTKSASDKMVWKRMEAYIETVMTRYKKDIDSWDVVNEYVETHEPFYRKTHLTEILGKDYPVKVFKLAKKICSRQ